MSRNQGLGLVVVIVMLVLYLAQAQGGALKRIPRGVRENPSTPEPSFCHRSTPCGWSVYAPFTRDIEYYMPNTCICREGLDCIRTENDISISAFVHMCRAKPDFTGKSF
ncbi:UNVERIFIED_CONTAM: hypothetical protein PYX00_010261 [Menopon gallinae]|uniref:Uncharacterized protein n=1 Tax=Menopon gallinae TaxID=328185 RepID=A0AAW2HFC5_9NEOP